MPELAEFITYTTCYAHFNETFMNVQHCALYVFVAIKDDTIDYPFDSNKTASISRHSQLSFLCLKLSGKPFSPPFFTDEYLRRFF